MTHPWLSQGLQAIFPAAQLFVAEVGMLCYCISAVTIWQYIHSCLLHFVLVAIIWPGQLASALPKFPLISCLRTLSGRPQSSRSQLMKELGIDYLIHVTALANVLPILLAGELKPGKRLEVKPAPSGNGLGIHALDEVYLQAFSRTNKGSPLFGNRRSAVDYYGTSIGHTPPAIKGTDAILVFRRELLDRTDFIACLGWNLGCEMGEEFSLKEIEDLFHEILAGAVNQFRFRKPISVLDLIEVWIHPEDLANLAPAERQPVFKPRINF
ncbi:MAG: hypothetical protein IPJ71_00735 [Bdellovibrionales bacterium]|nr:hypothetical protein [Bdellovibrionales bacterium]